MKIYKVVDFRPLLDEEGLDEATVLQIRQEQSKVKLEQVRSILFKLSQCDGDCGDLTAEEQKIRDMFGKVTDPDKFRDAASEDRLRAQVGIRERFRESIQVSRRYLRAMDKAGYAGHIVVEISLMVQRRPNYDPLAAATTSYEVLSSAFEDAGLARV